MNRVGLPSSKPKSPYLAKLDELLGKALEAFSKPRTRDAAHLAAMEEEKDNISQFIAGRSLRRPKTATIAEQLASTFMQVL